MHVFNLCYLKVCRGIYYVLIDVLLLTCVTRRCFVKFVMLDDKLSFTIMVKQVKSSSNQQGEGSVSDHAARLFDCQ